MNEMSFWAIAFFPVLALTQKHKGFSFFLSSQIHLASIDFRTSIDNLYENVIFGDN
ncbi:hypothetical protein [Floridanema flaviceps]|uniref:hypothetical protein n=1 Tax=Floridanema flaviceps TaxID=3396170 RepID=UPI0039A61E1F